jgi:hypothetical protein
MKIKVMPEVTIKYKKPETLKILKSLAKYFDFQVSPEKPKNKEPYKVNGVTIIPGSGVPNTDDLSDIFNGVDAAKLRKEAWQRKS